MKQAGKMGYRVSAIVLSLGVLALLSGCKGFFTAINNNTTGGGTSSFVYVTNVTGLPGAATGGTITEYSLTSGVLATLSGSPITLPGTAVPTSIVVAPNNAFLYVGTSLGVYLYTIGTDGTLTEGNSNTIVFQGAPASLAVDSTSSWLIIANKNSTELDALPISPTTGVPTSLTPASVTLSASAPSPQVTIAPANNNIFVAMGSGGTAALSFTATSSNQPLGKPLTINLLKNTSTASAVAVDTTSAYVFIAESNAAAGSTLRQIAVSSLNKDFADQPVGNGPISILPDLSGSYVYVANSTDGTISGFSFNAGAISATPLPNSPFPTEKQPQALVEDSSKTYLIDVGFSTNPNLWMYSLDPTSLGSLDVKTTTSTVSTSPSQAIALAVTH